MAQFHRDNDPVTLQYCDYKSDYSYLKYSVSGGQTFQVSPKEKLKFYVTNGQGTLDIPIRYLGYIRMVEDVDSSGKVDIKDLASLAKSYNVKLSNEGKFNSDVNDVTSSGTIDIYDIVKVARQL